MRTNTYDTATGTITIAPVRAAAFESLSKYYADTPAIERRVVLRTDHC